MFSSGRGIEPGDVVLIYTNYAPPMDEESYPETVTITREAAEYLAEMPIRAFATDAYSVANVQQQAVVESADPTAQSRSNSSLFSFTRYSGV